MIRSDAIRQGWEDRFLPCTNAATTGRSRNFPLPPGMIGSGSGDDLDQCVSRQGSLVKRDGANRPSIQGAVLAALAEMFAK